MVGLQTLDLAIGVRVPASQPINRNPPAESQTQKPLALTAKAVYLTAQSTNGGTMEC
jgi:hypothetical protein